MPRMTLKVGYVVRVCTQYDESMNIVANQENLDARREEGTLGRVVYIASGLVWVQHGFGPEAPYWSHELIAVGG